LSKKANASGDEQQEIDDKINAITSSASLDSSA
jgi:hypothetical protein